MLKYKVVLLLINLGGFVFSQNIDSLLTLIKNKKDDSLSYPLYIKLGGYYQNIYPDSALFYHKKALDITKYFSDFTKLANSIECHIQIGWDLTLLGKNDSAIKVYQKALFLINEYEKRSEVPIKLLELKASLLSNMGSAYSATSNYPLALDYYFKALNINEKTNRTYNNAVNNLNIGVIYKYQKDFNKAKFYYLRSLNLFRKINNSYGITAVYINLGSLFLDKKLYSEAIMCLEKALEQARKNNYKIYESKALYNLAYIKMNLKRYKESEKYFLDAIAINTSNNFYESLSESYGGLGRLYIDLNKLDLSLKYLKLSEKINKETGNIYNLKDDYADISELYYRKQDYKQALYYYKLCITYRDSILNQENQKASIEKEMQYNFDKEKALKEAEHKKQLAVEQEAKQRQKVISWAIGIGLMLVAVFLLIVFNRLQITRKQKNIIEEQKLVVEEQKQVVEEQKKLVEEKNKEIIDSITYAKRIQNAILPSPQKWKQALPDSFVLYLPKDIVAGDFYFMEQSGNYTFVAAADCTGHGVPGAMVSVVCSNALTRAILEEKITQTNLILNRVREIVIEKLTGQDAIRDGMDICLIRIEKGNNTIQYSGANRPLWYVENNTLIETKGDKQPIGKYEEAKPFTLHNIPLSNNSTLYLSTDGYADQFGGERGKKISVKALKEKLLQVAHKNIQEQYNELLGFYTNWKGTVEQIDDVTVLGIRITV